LLLHFCLFRFALAYLLCRICRHHASHAGSKPCCLHIHCPPDRSRKHLI